MKHPIRDLRAIIGKTQREFAAAIGVSASALKQIENRKRSLSVSLARQIRLEAGVDDKALLKGKLLSVWAREYKLKDYREWKDHYLDQDHDKATEEAEKLLPWIKILFRASAIGSKRRLWPVSEAVIAAINDCRERFELISATNEILKREYRVIDRKLGKGHYTWFPQGRGDYLLRSERKKSEAANQRSGLRHSPR